MYSRLSSLAGFVFRKLFFFFVAVLLIFFVISFVRGLIRAETARGRVREAKERVAKLKEENSSLEAKLEFVRSEEFTEQQIRDKLGLAKEGEIVVILPEDDVVRKFAPSYYEEEEEDLPDPNWKKWVKLFL